MAARVGGVEEFTGGLGPCLGRARDEVWHSVQVWFLLPAYTQVRPGTQMRQIAPSEKVLNCRWDNAFRLAGEQGFEPQYRGPEPRVLPLDDSPAPLGRQL